MTLRGLLISGLCGSQLCSRSPPLGLKFPQHACRAALQAPGALPGSLTCDSMFSSRRQFGNRNFFYFLSLIVIPLGPSCNLAPWDTERRCMTTPF